MSKLIASKTSITYKIKDQKSVKILLGDKKGKALTEVNKYITSNLPVMVRYREPDSETTKFARLISGVDEIDYYKQIGKELAIEKNRTPKLKDMELVTFKEGRITTDRANVKAYLDIFLAENGNIFEEQIPFLLEIYDEGAEKKSNVDLIVLRSRATAILVNKKDDEEFLDLVLISHIGSNIGLPQTAQYKFLLINELIENSSTLNFKILDIIINEAYVDSDMVLANKAITKGIVSIEYNPMQISLNYGTEKAPKWTNVLGVSPQTTNETKFKQFVEFLKGASGQAIKKTILEKTKN